MEFYFKILCLVGVFYLIQIPGALYSYLTSTEGWYKENWSTFFKRVIYGKLHCKEFNVTDDHQSTQVP
jgi:hypothetical protein